MKKAKAAAKTAGKTNATKQSLVKVVVLEDLGEWISPEKGTTHFITEDAELPIVQFQVKTANPGPYTWQWKIQWDAKVSGLKESAKRGKLLKSFTESGKATTTEPKWLLSFDGKVLGGTLTVELTSGSERFKRSIYLKGKNPSFAKIDEFVATLKNAKGFEKILKHEARGKNFINADGEPVVAFDKGYGMSQMTNPAPTFLQIWSWKENVNAGLKLYQGKRTEAEGYLKKKGADSFTEEQLQLETFTRYNGGVYHEWDATKKWVRKQNVLCDDQTGNIGWNTKTEANTEKSETELHKRDVETYKKGKSGQSDKHPWIYTGVCYADHVSDK
jgi:hypothetical protein